MLHVGIAVGTAITDRPPRRSVREVLPLRLLLLVGRSGQMCHHKRPSEEGRSRWLIVLRKTLSFSIPSGFIPALSDAGFGIDKDCIIASQRFALRRPWKIWTEMPRLSRLQYENAIYHVVTRGDGRRRLFQDEGHYGRFTVCLIDQVDRCGWSIIAFCWMPNHIHALVRTPQPNLARGMQHWLRGYANWSVKRNRRSGHLYQRSQSDTGQQE